MEELRVVTTIDIDTTDIFIKMRIFLENSNYDDLSNEKDKINLVLDF